MVGVAPVIARNHGRTLKSSEAAALLLLLKLQLAMVLGGARHAEVPSLGMLLQLVVIFRLLVHLSLLVLPPMVTNHQSV